MLWIQNDFFRIRSDLWTPSGFSPDPMLTSFQFLPNSVRIQCRLLFNTFRILSGSNKKKDQLKTSQIRIDNTKTSTWSWRYCRWWILCGELGGEGDMAASSTGGIIHPLATLLRSPYKTVWKLRANSWLVLPREMENISRGSTFEDFVTILTEGSTNDNTVARLQSTSVQTPLSPPLLNVMYCVRVSLSTV